jgi:hypothetical protein
MTTTKNRETNKGRIVNPENSGTVYVEVGDTEGVWVGKLFRDGAIGLSDVRNGTKFTTPKLKSFLKSCIDWLIAFWLVVPHQLSVAVIEIGVAAR